ncbi:uncharacterized protein RAG0_03533 [Rhynchosporium agropyri]|uniref:Uncharacterized protein n=1 Tax=Rhynchosporium agropyri TaxID=914238 RepID=A0A1E1K5E2_9HELO|nr:uncharacterized protein RAG0_03533 [Rhynchosporium agropyri]
MQPISQSLSNMFLNTGKVVVAKSSTIVSRARSSGLQKARHIPGPTLESLPMEIRLMIYEELILIPHTIYITENKEHFQDQGVIDSPSCLGQQRHLLRGSGLA